MISTSVFAITAVYSVHGTLIAVSGYVEASDMSVAETYVSRLVSVLGRPVLVTGIACDPVKKGVWFVSSLNEMVGEYYRREDELQSRAHEMSKSKWN
jgi:hypothetical protein